MCKKALRNAEGSWLGVPRVERSGSLWGGGTFMPMLEGVKCARCRIALHGTGTVFRCSKCGVFDTVASIHQEIAEQLHVARERNLLAKVGRVLDKIAAGPIRKSRITGAAYRFIPDEDAPTGN